MQNKNDFFNNIEAELNEKGFAKFSFLTEDDVNDLLKIYHEIEIKTPINSLHYSSTDISDYQQNIKIYSLVEEVISKPFRRLASNLKILAVGFHIKQPGIHSALGVHRDLTFVDESEYFSANIWIALQDIDKNNGNMYFLPGSHNDKTVRAVNSGYTVDNANLSDAVDVFLKKGEAVIFNNATIHGSNSNLSNNDRVALVILICPKEADWFLVYQEDNKKKRLKYMLDIDSFYSMPKNGRPKASYVKFDSDFNYRVSLRNRIRSIFSSKKVSGK